MKHKIKAFRHRWLVHPYGKLFMYDPCDNRYSYQTKDHLWLKPCSEYSEHLVIKACQNIVIIHIIDIYAESIIPGF